jgi:hypothetical protein
LKSANYAFLTYIEKRFVAKETLKNRPRRQMNPHPVDNVLFSLSLPSFDYN